MGKQIWLALEEMRDLLLHDFLELIRERAGHSVPNFGLAKMHVVYRVEAVVLKVPAKR